MKAERGEGWRAVFCDFYQCTMWNAYVQTSSPVQQLQAVDDYRNAVKNLKKIASFQIPLAQIRASFIV